MTPRFPYVMMALDDVLALYAGVSPEEPIGEPVWFGWLAVRTALDRGYEVAVLTWRDPALVHAWMDRAKLTDLYQHDGFMVTRDHPIGRPALWCVNRVDLEGLAMLPNRKVSR